MPRRKNLLECFIQRGPEECWIWTHTIDKQGYPRYSNEGGHCAVYRHFKGDYASYLHIDHLCRNPLCVNPNHLEPVTQRENTLRGNSFSALNARKTHCKRGHEFTPENTINRNFNGNNARECKACKIMRRK